MGKGGKGGQHYETFQRINFLYQAAQLCLIKSPQDPALCRFYINSLKTITRRQVLRIHPDMKRTLCKKCDILLLPGVTAKVRTRAKREKHSVVTCVECGCQKRFLWRKNYKPWFLQPGAWISKQQAGTSASRPKTGEDSQKKAGESQKTEGNGQVKVDDSLLKVGDGQEKAGVIQKTGEQIQEKAKPSRVKDQRQEKMDTE